MSNIGIFLDRDGTINEEVDYLTSPDNLRLFHGSANAIREANTLGLKVFIITNQSAIARGLLTEQQLSKIHDMLVSKLRADGARLDAIYYCPHHPDFGDAPYNKDCDCRKPNIGMLERAVKEFDIDLKKSFVIGDKMTDIQTGNNAGTKTILVLTGYGKQELDLCHQQNAHIDYVAEHLPDAMQYVKRIVQQTQPLLS
jgi:D-glycero-D-manno-heptose 1,7-bisphosphate phosphatase